MEFIIYSKDNCPYCVRAKDWLNLNNLGFTEKSLNDDKLRQDFYDECGNGVRTVPQIFVRYGENDDFVRIGGYAELMRSDILTRKDIEINGDF